MSASAVASPYKLHFGYNGSSCFSFMCIFDACKTAFSTLRKKNNSDLEECTLHSEHVIKMN